MKDLERNQEDLRYVYQSKTGVQANSDNPRRIMLLRYWRD